MVFSGPLVRSSYMADLVNEQASEQARYLSSALNFALAALTGVLLILIFPISISPGSRRSR